MIWTLGELFRWAQQCQAHIGGRYVPARPYTGTFWFRVRPAWEVLMGRADAFRWPGGQ